MQRMWLALLIRASLAASVPTSLPPDPERGRALYRRDCWQCHGAKGLGEGPADGVVGATAPPLAGRVPQERWDALIGVIRSGRGGMPGYEAVIGDTDAKRILVWLDQLDPETGADPTPPSSKRKKKLPSEDAVLPSKKKPARATDAAEDGQPATEAPAPSRPSDR